MPREDLVDIRGGTVTEWTAANPVLAANEIAVVWEDDMSRSTVIVGDGSTQAMDLYTSVSGTYRRYISYGVGDFTVTFGTGLVIAEVPTNDGVAWSFPDGSTTAMLSSRTIDSSGNFNLVMKWTNIDGTAGNAATFRVRYAQLVGGGSISPSWTGVAQNLVAPAVGVEKVSTLISGLSLTADSRVQIAVERQGGAGADNLGGAAGVFEVLLVPA